MDLGGPFDLQVDPAEAERRKRARLVQINTLVVPRLRVVGFALVATAALIHNALIYPGWDAFVWRDWLRLVAIFAVYSGVTWYILYLFYEDAARFLDLGTVFLATDLSMFSVAIHSTGAERSWMFILPMFRVIDQTPTTFRRALIFAHLAPLAYAGVLADVVLREQRPVAWTPEVAKLIFIYIGSIYTAMVARAG
jgi:hypothetical protein